MATETAIVNGGLPAAMPKEAFRSSPDCPKRPPVPGATTMLAPLSRALILAAACLTPLQEEVADYAGHQVVRTTIRTEADLALMRRISPDCFSHHAGLGSVDWRVPPEAMAELKTSGIKFDVLVQNLGARIEAERARLAQEGGGGGNWYAEYRDLEAINARLDELASLRPDLATASTIGVSIEGRGIRTIRITSGSEDKPQVLINGCQHAREWISPMTVMSIAEQLITLYDLDAQVKNLVDRVEFHIVPMVNPDGYVHTWGPNRLWRKNRRENGNGTFGVDLNRNWDYEWGHDSGSSGSPGDETYRGPAPFSEPETQALRDLALALPRLVGHLDVHNYGLDLLRTWGYTSAPPPDIDAINDVGSDVASALTSVHGQPYVHGPGAITSGTSKDWFYGDRHVVSYTLELRDDGSHNFLLPPGQIIPTCEETWAGVLRYAERLLAGTTFSGPPLDVVAAGQATPLDVSISPLIEGTLDVNSAVIWTRLDPAESFTPSPLAHMGDEWFHGSLPPVGCDATMDYYVEISSLGGAPFTYPAAAAINVATAALVYEDSGNEDTGWSVANYNFIDGAWERGVPVGGGDRGDPPADYDGSGWCYLTDNTDGDSDVDGGPTRLTSPALDLSGIADPYVSFAHWLTCDTGEDRLKVQISNNDGSSWALVEEIAPHPTWAVKVVRVNDYVTPSATVRLRFSAKDNPSNSITEAAIDQLRVLDPGCPTTAELTGDGVVNVQDLLVMLGQWGPCGGCPADLNGDGVVNVLDLLELLAAWG